MLEILILLSCWTCILSLTVSVSDKWKLTIPISKQREYQNSDDSLWQYLNDNIPEALSHTGSTSFDVHLKGVQSILRAWSCSDHVANAGLFHSIYGTEGFQGYKLPFSERKRIREMIGQKAESLVFKFCVADRFTVDEIVRKHHDVLFNNNHNNDECLSFEIKSRIELGRFDIKFKDMNEWLDFIELTLADWLEQVEGAAQKANPLFEWNKGESYSYRRTAYSRMADILTIKRNLKKAKDMLNEIYEQEPEATRGMIQEITPPMSEAAKEARLAYAARIDE